ncbi:hypothetical protein Tco_0000157 [Tanacetum coccineum]
MSGTHLFAGDCIPDEVSPAMIPQRHVTRETYPQRQVARESPENLPGIDPIVVVDQLHHRWFQKEAFESFCTLSFPCYNGPACSFMLTLLIPGPKSSGKDIDVYLRPLIEDLKVLWDRKGVETIDVASGQKFNMRAMVLWTINDFPA